MVGAIAARSSNAARSPFAIRSMMATSLGSAGFGGGGGGGGSALASLPSAFAGGEGCFALGAASATEVAATIARISAARTIQGLAVRRCLRKLAETTRESASEFARRRRDPRDREIR